MKNTFDIDALTSKINNVKQELKRIDNEDKIKKYGTYLDSKQEIVQLYILFMFFGVNLDIIQTFPEPTEYDVD